MKFTFVLASVNFSISLPISLPYYPPLDSDTKILQLKHCILHSVKNQKFFCGYIQCFKLIISNTYIKMFKIKYAIKFNSVSKKCIFSESHVGKS